MNDMILTKEIICKRTDRSARTADFIASTDAVDAHGEVIDQNSWLLERFRSNPVILYGHNRNDLPIGKSIRTEVVDGQLECTIEFAPAAANPQAEQVWQLVQGGYLKAVSVGFRPKDGKYEMRDEEEVFVFYGNELREISVVSIPANPDAVAKEIDRMKDAARHADDDLPTRTRRKAASTTTSSEQTDAPPTNNEGAEAPAEKSHMIIAPEVQKKLDDNALAIAELRLAAKTAEDGQAKAIERAGALDGRVKALESENALLLKQTDELTKDRDVQRKRADEAEAKQIDVEVGALVGVKITPAEKEDFIELKKTNPKLFEKMVSQRGDLKLLETVIKAGSDDKSAPTGDAATKSAADAAFMADLEKLAGPSDGLSSF